MINYNEMPSFDHFVTRWLILILNNTMFSSSPADPKLTQNTSWESSLKSVVVHLHSENDTIDPASSKLKRLQTVAGHLNPTSCCTVEITQVKCLKCPSQFILFIILFEVRMQKYIRLFHLFG
jgi:hypothetical protein